MAHIPVVCVQHSAHSARSAPKALEEKMATKEDLKGLEAQVTSRFFAPPAP